MQELMRRDTTENCLRLMVVEFSLDLSDLTGRISRFVDVRPETCKLWLQQGRLPGGERLLRLRFFLEFSGYAVTENESLQPAVFQLGELISLRIMSPDEIVKEIGYTSTDELWKMLLGRVGTSKEKQGKMSELITAHVAELSAAFISFTEKVGSKQSVGSFTRRRASLIPQPLWSPQSSGWMDIGPIEFPEPPATVAVAQEELIAMLAYQLQAMLPLANRVDSDDFTAAQRKQLRQLAGRDTVFELSNALNRLCSERAREVYTNRSPKE